MPSLELVQACSWFHLSSGFIVGVLALEVTKAFIYTDEAHLAEESKIHLLGPRHALGLAGHLDLIRVHVILVQVL